MYKFGKWLFIFLCVVTTVYSEASDPKHTVMKCSGCNVESLTNSDNLTNVIYDAANQCGATAIQNASCILNSNGFIIVLPFNEGDVILTSTPANAFCFIDFFTSTDQCSVEIFFNVLNQYILSGQIDSCEF